MRTVESLIRELQKFPPDAMSHAHEGERCGVTILVRQPSKHSSVTLLGFVDATEWIEDESDVPADEERSEQ